MGWFTRTIKNPDEVFERLCQSEQKVSEKAKNEFIECLNSDHIKFLVRKFKETENSDVRLNILEIFAATNNRDYTFTIDELKDILTLIVYPDTLYRETFKEILLGINLENLKAVTEFLSNTSDLDIHRTIQHGIESSGILTMFLKQWNEFSIKEQILYIKELVLIQNPKSFPIFIDIMKEETVDAKKEDKKILQMEFLKYVDNIKSPEFLEICTKSMVAIAPALRYSIFKCFQIHGNEFFKRIFEKLDANSDGYRLNIIQLIDQLSDPISYPYLFPFLLDSYKPIPPIVCNTINTIIKTYCDELELKTPEQRNSEPELKKIDYYVKPIEENLTENHTQSIKTLTECLLRIGRFVPDVVLRNLPKLYKYNLIYLKSFLKGIEKDERKQLLIDACCYENEETGLTALKLLSDPTENFIVETLNTLLLEHFMKTSKKIQTEVINIMMNPRLQRFIDDVLFHQNPELRSRILWILGESGSPNVLQIIETKLRDPDYIVRENILKILDLPQFKNEDGTEILLKLLSDSDPNIVLQTIERLKVRDNPAIIGNLSKLMKTTTNSNIKMTSQKAIAFITRRKYLLGFSKMNLEAKLSIGTSLIKMDPTFMKDIAENLTASDQKVRVLSAEILQVLCNQIPPELKPNLIVALTDPDPKVRAVVIMGLGKIGGPSVAGLLVSYLKDQDDRVRANAVEAMQLIGDSSLVNDIIPCLYDENNRVRANAIMTLWKLGYYQIFDAVANMLRDQDKWMRASAIFALGELKDPSFFQILLSVLRDTDPDVRRNAVVALSKIAPPYTLAPYIRPLRFDSDEKVRKEVMAVLTYKPGNQK